MKKLLLILTILFTGCSNATFSSIFQTDDNYIQLTQYTKRGEIIQSLETVSLINATYFNHFSKDNNDTKNNEVFIVGVYNYDDTKADKKGIFNPSYTLTLNNIKFTKAEPITLKDLNLKKYPFYNKWMRYYKVYFPTSSSNNLTLKYTNINENSSTTLKLLKNIY